jgi:hypothetical protein
MARCSAIKANGERCKGIAKAGSEWCPAHDPARAEERHKAASKAARSKPGRELIEVKDRLRELAEDILSGEADRGRAAVAGQILNVYLRAVSVEIKQREVEELERRLEELESYLQARGSGGRGYG